MTRRPSRMVYQTHLMTDLVVQVVVGVELLLPDGWFARLWLEDSQEDIHCVLLLCITERIN